MQKEDFNKFAKLLEYPQDGYKELVSILSKGFGFQDFTQDKSLNDLQELYIKTFEVEPLCNLYIGVHIFGEDGFKRGSFMARLKEAYLNYQVEENDIADFLPCILKLAAKINDDEKYKSLIEECILYPLNTILDNFSEKSNPYRDILLTLKNLCKKILSGKGQVTEYA